MPSANATRLHACMPASATYVTNVCCMYVLLAAFHVTELKCDIREVNLLVLSSADTAHECESERLLSQPTHQLQVDTYAL